MGDSLLNRLIIIFYCKNNTFSIDNTINHKVLFNLEEFQGMKNMRISIELNMEDKI